VFHALLQIVKRSIAITACDQQGKCYDKSCCVHDEKSNAKAMLGYNVKAWLVGLTLAYP
jgi:hypothetical protein